MTLTNTIGCIFCALMYGGMAGTAVEMGIFGENQNDFERDRRGSDNLYSFGEILGRTIWEERKMYEGFLYKENVYDMVDWDRL